ncbi:hypothetical protein NDK47_08405 [Brevibacillus ruminantium]|uniref:Peptidase n=1 Tax=Brevibacillus ruminantium TaxID=2950604 RepID=A0ABY4WJG8_9BACL|nr:hypothetical protein [Brevibacillus ruminantium]USG67281.1 hypothetical protein NDK47_08405 [Brevibacillus ruminantium]
MKYGKTSAAVLIACTLFATPVWGLENQAGSLAAAAQLGKEELPFRVDMTMTGVRNDIPLLRDMKVGPITFENGLYSVSLSNESKVERRDQIATATIKVNEDGELVSLNVKEPDTAEGKKPDLYGDKRLVNDFIRDHLSPEFTASPFAVLGQKDENHENKAIWSVYPTLNGIPLQRETGKVVVDGKRNIVFVKWNKTKVPNEASVDHPKNAVTVEKAKNTIVENLKLELVYDPESGEWLYLPKTVEAVDALTGESVSPMRVVKEEEIEIDGQADLSAWKDGYKLERVLKAALQLPTVPVDIREDKVAAAETKARWDGPIQKTGIHAVFGTEKKDWTIRVDDEVRKPSEEPLSLSEARKLAVDFMQNVLVAEKKTFFVKTESLSEELPKWAEKPKGPREYAIAFHEQFAQGAKGMLPLYTIVVDADRGGIKEVRHEQTPGPKTESKLANVVEKSAKDAILRELEISLYYVYPEYGGQTPSLPQLAYLPANVETLAINAQTGELVRRVAKQKDTR